MEGVKHGGCAECGNTDQQILTSIAPVKPGQMTGAALCDKCLAKK
ncbi:hypothetical protein [uncultured Brevibacillus sp.]|nr:hypothetical protein [uncultured Brevibacillus sp.]